VEETIVEVSKRASPTGQRMIVKPYPKDNEWRRMGLRPALLDQLSEHIAEHDIDPDDLLFATRDGTPISRNTFRTRAWKPAIAASGVDFNVRIHDLRHDLRHAHASWLLAGGADLNSVMDRMGHSLIQTTQKYLHTLRDADQRNLDAFTRITDPTESR
jgi:integrase